ncbi:response regulator [Candidatus Symbiopectobacterium endolongispinus]|nr:response regulator [Candidatus Symbiopectobacterium sp. PLON1]MBT9429437.1 response regulator [Candidatus Symbiopectobacterium endolongispinus]
MPNDDSATLLLIDDHPMLRNGVKQLLSMVPGLRVVGEASDGEQGVILAAELDPDLISLDLNMPGMNGLETLVRLREKALSGRVVVFSVSDHEDDVVSALKNGADGYLLKDMEPEDLLASLHQAASGKTTSRWRSIFELFGASKCLTRCATVPIKVFFLSAAVCNVGLSLICTADFR